MRHLTRYITGSLFLALATSLQAPALASEEPAGQVVIIREPGKPDKRCVVEKSVPQSNGAILHEVRNLATGERYRVIDHRPPNAVALQPKDKARIPTPAELAISSSVPSGRTLAEHAGLLKGTTTTVAAPSSVPSIPNVISAASSNWPANEEAEASATKHIQLLRSSPDASLRETAALALAASESRKKTEVIDALATGAKSDPDSAVRICCLRCLCQLSKELPQVIPTIQELQTDADERIQQIAHSAMQDLAPQAVQGSQR